MTETIGYSDPQRAPIIYLAAPWKDREYARTVRVQFQAAGVVVNSRWLDFKGEEDVVKDATMKQEALHDIEDVVAADTVVVLNTSYSEGKAAETGMALILMKGLVLIGKPSNVFHYLDFPKVETVEEAIEVVKNYPWRLTQLSMTAGAVEEFKEATRPPLVTEA